MQLVIRINSNYKINLRKFYALKYLKYVLHHKKKCVKTQDTKNKTRKDKNIKFFTETTQIQNIGPSCKTQNGVLIHGQKTLLLVSSSMRRRHKRWK